MKAKAQFKNIQKKSVVNPNESINYPKKWHKKWGEPQINIDNLQPKELTNVFGKYLMNTVTKIKLNLKEDAKNVMTPKIERISN